MTEIEKYYKLKPGYEYRTYLRVRRQLRDIFNSLPIETLTYSNAAPTIGLNINEDVISNVLFNVYTDIGIKYGVHVMRYLEAEKKAKPFPLFSEAFIRFVQGYLRTLGGKLITSITETMKKAVIDDIRKLQAEGATVNQMQQAIHKRVGKRNFYRWQAMRIARTEVGFAMNASKEVAINQAGIQVYKVWIHGHTKDPRHQHITMDGKMVRRNEDFVLPDGTRMSHPHDPRGGAEHNISCSCTYAFKPIRDSQGRLITI